MTYELGCWEQMYKIVSEEIKPSALRVVFYEIVERAYHVSLEGVKGGEEHSSKSHKDWEEDAKRFPDIGLEISTTLNGENY